MVNLSIIILNYNTKDLTISCLRSLVKQYIKELKNGEFEIIVVDNASSDGSVGAIQSSKFKVQNYSSKLKIIENDKNYGFAKGCNIGAKASGGKYILFLNSDTQVLDKGFLRMTEFLDGNQQVGILGGRLSNLNGSPQPSCGKFYTLLNLFLMLVGMERFGFLRTSPNTIQKVGWVSGGCMMVRKSSFERLKGFDDNFFMYMEDMELCFRAKKLGFPTYFYPNIKLIHQSLGSSNREFAIKNIERGILYFYKKHESYWQYFLAKILLSVKGALRI